MMKSTIKYVLIVLIILSFIIYKFVFLKYIPDVPIAATKLQLEDGKILDVNSLKGQVYIVSFFQSWCGDCRREIPELEALQKNVGGKKYLKILMISDESFEKIQQVKNASKANLDFYQSSEKLKDLGIRRYPTTYLINKNGKTVEAKTEHIFWNNEENIDIIKKLNQ